MDTTQKYHYNSLIARLKEREMDLLFFLIILIILWILKLQKRIETLEKIIEQAKPTKPKEEINLHSLASSRADQPPISPIPIHEESDSLEIESKDEATLQSLANNSKEYGFLPTAKFTMLFHEISHRLFGGNILVRLGGVVLFFGLAFLAKYAAAHSHLNSEIKVASLIAIGIGISLLGWRFRHREGGYGMILQGIGIAVVFLSLFVAQNIYGILQSHETFGAMLITLAAAIWLALRQNSMSLALFAELGGFLVPILSKTSQEDLILFFGYYALLDLGILLIALRRAWILLNIVGFLSTYLIATTWGVLNYKPIYFKILEPFWIYFYLLYLFIPILEARIGKVLHQKVPFNALILFGLPLLALPQQMSLVKYIEHGALFSSLALGILYIIISLFLKRLRFSKSLYRAYKALGVLFLTLAIPLFFTEQTSATIWALEGAILLYRSRLAKEPDKLQEWGGHILLISSFWIICFLGCQSSTKLLASYLVIIASYLVGAWALDQKALDSTQKRLTGFYLIIALFIWFIALNRPLQDLGVITRHTLPLSLLIASILIEIATIRISWRRITQAQNLYAPAAILLFLADLFLGKSLMHSFSQYGAPLYFAILIWGYIILWRYQDRIKAASWLHLLWFVSALAFTTLEAGYWGAQLIKSPEGRSLAITLSLLLGFATASYIPLPRRFATFWRSYRLEGAGIAALFLSEMILYLGRYRTQWGAHIPLLNPLDIVQIAGALAIGFWLKRISELITPQTRLAFWALYGILLLPLPAMIWARNASMIFDISWNFSTLWHSPIFQSGLSLIYTLSALILILYAKKSQRRWLWFIGFGILIAVVVKLFFIDLSGSGTLARIISFIGVGTALLLLGYLVPLPPSIKDNESKRAES